MGLDAADWLAIDPLIRSGSLPAFARLRSAGRTGIMLATPPLLSPILWTTIATGRAPEDHGVLDFMVDLPSGAQAPVGSAQRRVPALWNLFSAAGRTVAVVGWWATWPAEDVRGTIVTDQVAPQLTRPDERLEEGALSPGSAGRLHATIVRPRQISFEDLSGYLPLTRAEYEEAMAAADASPSRFYVSPIAHLAAVAASTRTHSAMAEALLRDRPDLLAVYLEGIDTVSHRFIRDEARGRAAIQRAYRDADALLLRLAAASPAETLIVVCSDHGFQPASAGIAEDPADLVGPATAWHRPYGIVAAITAGSLAGSGAPASPSGGGHDLGTVTPLDIAPTLLHAAGLPVAAEMPGRVVTAMLPDEAARRPVRRAATPQVAAPSAPRVLSEAAGDEARSRLQALGYLGAASTSLARQNLGEVLYRAGRLPAAERELRAVVEGQPQNLTAHLWLAKALAGQGRAREALRVYERAIGLPGDRGEAILEAVDLAVSSGSREEARRLLGAARRTADNRASLHVARGTLAQADGRTALAERELRSALAMDPASFPALSRLLDVLIASRRARAALPPLRDAARRLPGSARHQALLGEAWLAAGDPAAAEPLLARALELAPDSAAVRLDLARAQMGARKVDEAIRTLAPAPPSVERDILLGAARSMQGRWAEAADHYRSALQQGSPTPELLNGLGWAQLKLGRAREAAGLFDRSLTLDRHQPEISRLLAQIGRSAPAP